MTLRSLSTVIALVGTLTLSGTETVLQALGQGEGGQATFKGGVEAVTVTVAVRDSRGRVIKDLRREDFELVDSGFGRPISDFYAGDAAISLAIVLDISGSMAVGGNIGRARDAVNQAIAVLQPSQDEAALFTFDSKLQQVVPFTTDLDLIRRVSLEGRPWGVTSLFDSIGETARTVAERSNRHRAVLVITDGIDTASRLTAAQVSGIASSIDVPVYLLAVVTPTDHPGGEFGLLTAAGQSEGIGTPADLARWTGGDIRIASMPAHTVAAVRDIFGELRQQYVITFEPGARPGWHPIEVRVRKRNLVVRARSGYMAGPARSGS